jgi:hypothetical protein
MRAELILMGKRIDMAARARRRALVIAIYAGIAAVMAATWFLDHWRHTGSYILWAALFACYLFLGGTTFGGLVKPFHNRRRITYDSPQPFLLLKLRTYLPTPGEESDYLNDERELYQRGYAHYRAYQVIGIAVVLILTLSLFRMQNAEWFRWIPVTPDTLYYGLLLIVVVLFLTLPQSILLWTEPDMEPAPEFAEQR